MPRGALNLALTSRRSRIRHGGRWSSAWRAAKRRSASSSAPYAMSLPAIVQHLAMLENSGLVRSEKVGRVRTFRVVPAALSLAEMGFNQRRSQWEQRLDRLGEHLNEYPDREPK